jgi:hypothetical protein
MFDRRNIDRGVGSFKKLVSRGTFGMKRALNFFHGNVGDGGRRGGGRKEK